ncbi:hypothetical protein [Rosistilla oblonga]|uniref:hypothetical protein n=1 Tax=Rosistilla oblonga TaxID=2527990 RepID=UPI003A97C7A3
MTKPIKAHKRGHILAIVMIGIVVWKCHRCIFLEFTGERAWATIEGRHESSSRKYGGWSDWYLLLYTGKDGIEHEAKLKAGPFWLRPGYGESLAILYAPDNPSVVAHDSRVGNWLLPLIASCVVFWAMLDPQLKLLKRFETSK